ncbi:hypothetical protein EJB05_47299, partial [Eragrostis curvula]
MAEPLFDPSCIRIKHRFSTYRLHDVVNSLSDTQKQFVERSSFQKLLNVSKFSCPAPLMQWVMDHLIVGLAEFRQQDKCIKFTKQMMKLVLGVPSGELPVKLSSSNEAICAIVEDLKAGYVVGQKCSFANLTSKLLSDENEESFMRSFVLLVISSVMCPSTQNYVNLNYLYSLIDITNVGTYDWVGHALDILFSEVKRYQVKVGTEISQGQFYVGSCLPFLAIVYMDFLDLEHPDVDRKKTSIGRNDYGAILFRDVSTTPYAVQAATVDEDPANDGFNAVEPDEVPSNAPNVDHPQVDEHPSFGNILAQVDASIRPLASNHFELMFKEVSDYMDASSTVLAPGVINGLGPILANRISLLSSDVYLHAMSLNQNNAVNDSHYRHSTNSPVIASSDCHGHSNSEDIVGDFYISQRTPLVNRDISMVDLPSGLRDINDADTNNGILIAMGSDAGAANVVESPMTQPLDGVIVHSGQVRTGTSTIDKRNRKKRHAISFDEDCVTLKLSNVVEDFYIKYVRIERSADLVPDPNAHHDDSDSDADDDMASIYLHLWHDLLHDSDWFNPRAVEPELTRINAEFDILHADLLLFPVERACKVAGIFDRSFESYEVSYPSCPKHSSSYFMTKNEGGIYIMLFMEYFNGRYVIKFH